MPRVRLKGINTVRAKLAGGKMATYYYHRATGTKIVGEPGTAEFQAPFEAAGRNAALARSEHIYLEQRFSDHAPLVIDYDFVL